MTKSPVLLLASLMMAACATAPAANDPAPIKTGCKRPPPTPGEQLPAQLDKIAIVTGMSCPKIAIAACYDRFKQQGLALISYAIAPTGDVESAVLVGEFAGTPQGACIETASRDAKFPAFTGPPMTFKYPVTLR